MQAHTVIQGESLSNIAIKYGLDWNTVWNHSSNDNLKTLRKDPNVLYPGDIVMVPDKTVRSETRGTEARHKFIRHDVYDTLEIRLLKDFKPRANATYTLVVDKHVRTGTTDSSGWLRETIPAASREAKLLLDDGNEEYELAIGHVDPIDTISGLQGRLFNLGFLADVVTGEMNDETTRALELFQTSAGLPVSGSVDDATVNALKTEYGC